MKTEGFAAAEAAALEPRVKGNAAVVGEEAGLAVRVSDQIEACRVRLPRPNPAPASPKYAKRLCPTMCPL